MKKSLIFWCILIAFLYLPVSGQTVTLPWSAVDGGGHRDTLHGLSLYSVAGQPTGGVVTNGGFVLENGYLSGLRVLQGTTATVFQTVGSGWNMISVPVQVADYHKTTLYPGAASNAFFYSSGYAVAPVLANGVGYWLQYASAAPIFVSGAAIAAETLAVYTGWNMIGPPSYPLLKSAIVVNGTTTLSNYFSYKNGYGYQVVDTLFPGLAYWIQVSGNGTFILGAGSLAQKLLPPAVLEVDKSGHSADPLLSSRQWEEVKNFSSITFTDAGGVQRTLYYSHSVPQGTDLSAYTLPPVAPDNLLDVRFSSQRTVTAADPASFPAAFPVALTGGRYPVTISWKGSAERSGDYLLWTDSHGKKNEASFAADGELTLNAPDGISGLRIVMDHAAAPDLPKSFALYQNYPNPFNPSTTIRYDVAKAGMVHLAVYNLLGEEVVSLVNAVRQPGRYSVPFMAERLASGVYFYRLEAGEVQFTKKLVLMK
ncbi:MAG TPA: T9SS type A sorting domain-containing protein [Bacteroidota bacterium]|nr:T9SS type A sorting domain-containing protein [Bacteroidota bacterium]